MPPNKKKKGKDKKTKKQSSGEGRYHWEKWAAGGREDKAFPKPWVKCDHGTDDTLIPSSSNHPVAKLMNSFEDEIELSPNGYTIRSLVGAQLSTAMKKCGTMSCYANILLISL